MRAPWLSLVLLLGACHWAPVPLEELPRKIEEAACRKAVRCGLASARVDCGHLGADSAWALWPGAYAELRPLRNAAQAGLVRYDAAVAARCLETWTETSSCAGVGWPPACPEAFVGPLLDGAPCPGIGCAPGLTCLSAANACGGTCRPLTRAGQSPELAPCEDGLTTIYHSDAGYRCDAPPGAGEPCDPCSSDFTDCTPPCADGLSCEVLFDGGVRHCAPTPILDAGALCLIWQRCEPGAVCDTDDAGLQRCIVLADLDAPCGRCLAGLFCEAGLCTLGSSERLCAGVTCGEGRTCDRGRCTGSSSGALDAPCDAWAQDCGDGLYCGQAPQSLAPARCLPDIDAGTPCRDYRTPCGLEQSCRPIDGGTCVPLAAPCE